MLLSRSHFFNDLDNNDEGIIGSAKQRFLFYQSGFSQSICRQRQPQPVGQKLYDLNQES